MFVYYHKTAGKEALGVKSPGDSYMQRSMLQYDLKTHSIGVVSSLE